jgi:2-(1,2-epoxy-1,2-dihydrophenyl)acetyl-CoA isomerase
MGSAAEITVEDGIGWLTLRRPEAGNPMNPEFVEGTLSALDALPDGLGALVVFGEGQAFSVGGDIKFFHAAITERAGGERFPPLLVGIHSIMRRLRALPVPTVAAVEGAAAGGGIGLACACDLRVIGTSTVFVPGFGALGLSPDSGTSYHLTRALGSPAANAAFLRNRRITAAELAACGLADEVVPDGEVRPAAQRLAVEVAGAAPGALLATRRLVDSAPGHSFDEHLDDEARTISALFPTDDFAEGVSAFVEKRKPAFRHEV